MHKLNTTMDKQLYYPEADNLTIDQHIHELEEYKKRATKKIIVSDKRIDDAINKLRQLTLAPSTVVYKKDLETNETWVAFYYILDKNTSLSFNLKGDRSYYSKLYKTSIEGGRTDVLNCEMVLLINKFIDAQGWT